MNHLLSTNTSSEAPAAIAEKKKSRAFPRISILIRRLHLYAGLFLLPWVFLYGITGAMFNHQGLFPEAKIVSVPGDRLATSSLSSFPSAEELAVQVVGQLQVAAPDSKITLADNHGAEFNNEVILEVRSDETKHAVHIDPVARSARVAARPEPAEPLLPLLADVNSIRLTEDPYELAKQAVPQIMTESGLQGDTSIHPLGWCKLNFLAAVDGELARVTYVLRDGHVDVTEFAGEDGMSPRQFLMRLHTSHGQPPHWNARMMWSLILDTMAIAMVTWGVSGLVMWWQLKRTRLLGGVVIMLSLLTATYLVLSMSSFYATTKL